MATIDENINRKAIHLAPEDAIFLANTTADILESREQKKKLINNETENYNSNFLKIKSWIRSLFGRESTGKDVETEEKIKLFLGDIVSEEYKVYDTDGPKEIGNNLTTLPPYNIFIFGRLPVRVFDFSMHFPKQINYARLEILSKLYSVVSVQFHEGDFPGEIRIQIHTTLDQTIAGQYYENEMASCREREKTLQGWSGANKFDKITASLALTIAKNIDIENIDDTFPVIKGRAVDDRRLSAHTTCVKLPIYSGQIKTLMANSAIGNISIRPHENTKKCLMIFEVFSSR